MKLANSFSRIFIAFAILSAFTVHVSLGDTTSNNGILSTTPSGDNKTSSALTPTQNEPADGNDTSVLIVCAGNSPPTAELMATGRFSVVDYFDASAGTPSLATLSSYDSVLTYSNYTPLNAVALGNVLADYVDIGGRISISTYLFSTPWEIKGRIMTSGYSPLTNLGINGDVSGMLVATTPDPVFEDIDLPDVNYFHNSNFAHPGVDAGATLLATDGSGINMIAVNNNRRVFGFNLFPGTNIAGNNAEFYNLLANSLVGGPADSLGIAPWENFNSAGDEGGPFTPASKNYTLTNTGPNSLNWTANATQPWLEVAPASGTISPGNSDTVNVMIKPEANGLPAGIYNDIVTFTNIHSGFSQMRNVQLTVDVPLPPPPQPANPDPCDGATNVPVYKVLTWNNGVAKATVRQDVEPGVRSGLESYKEIGIPKGTFIDAQGQGGPDPCGYTFVDSDEPGGPSFNWIEISGTGTNLNLSDDSYFFPINLPFNFNFYDTDYTQVAVGSNGAVYFMNQYMTYGNVCIPGSNGSGIQQFIALYWDDLYPSGANNVYYKIVGSTPNRILVVQWQNVSHYGSSGDAVTAQAQLLENGDILLLYANPSSEAGAGATVGIQNDASIGLGYLCNQQSLHSGLAILFTCGGRATYDVYFDTVNPPETLIHSGLTIPRCEPVPYPLDYETTYYWQVVASNSSSQTAGPVWSFTTIEQPGEIEVEDSIIPIDDLNMPFGQTFIGLPRTEHITITNTDPTHGLTITDISLGGGYFEDFNDGLAQNWHEDIDDSWQVIAGEYRAQSSTNNWMMAYYEAKQWEDLSVQMTCRRTGSTDTSAAVTLRASSNFDNGIGSAYVFQITIAGYYGIWKQVNGSFSWLQSWTPSPSITTGTNTLTAVAEGSLLKFFINGTLVWTGSDNALISGDIGLGGYTEPGGYETTHYFDNVLVGKPITSAQTISDEQLWYNQHSYDGGEPQAAPKDWVPSLYPGKNNFQQQSAQKISTLSSDEAFRLENLPSLPLVIPPLGNVTFDVVFEPNSAEVYESSVVIKSNDANESEVAVQLTGTGVLDYLQITPQQDVEFTGHPGGPFLPSNTYYNLTNNGTINISWWTAAEPNCNWLNISPSRGIIKPGETTKVKVAPNAQACSKCKGAYSAKLLFTDVNTTIQQPRNVILTIVTEPKIWITPPSFDVNVYIGSSGSENLAIGNGGDGLLNFTLRGKQTGFTPASIPSVGVYDSMIETKKDVEAMAPAKHSFTAMTANRPFAEGRMLVRFAQQTNKTWPGLAAKNSILAKVGGKLAAARITKEYRTIRGLSLVKLPDNVAVKDALVTLNNTPGVLYAEPDYQVKALSAGQIIPNDPRFAELWGLNNTGQSGGTSNADINAPEAWNISTNGTNVIVAVIDTGIDYTHPDLAANMWVNAAEANGLPGVDDDGNGYIDDIYGYDFVNNDGNPMDDHYHGTHCAGTIGAVGNNGVGVTGVCWNAKIMALKFLDSSGSGYDSDAIECIHYAILMGAKVLSNSWGGGGYSQALKDAIDAAGNANILFIAAAGNSNSNNDTSPFYPASYTSANIIAVLATDRYDNMSGFSSYGLTSVDIGAPGSDILSCQPGGNYQYLSGTSMATPHVSGAAALVWSSSPSTPYQEVKDLLIQTADKIPAMAGRCVSQGRLNLYNALNETGVSWLEFAPQSGSVLPGEVNNVSVLFHGDVPVGTYQGQITVLTNDPYTPEANIPVTMTVEPLDYFTELFNAGDNDMAHRTLTFTPNGSANYYNLCTKQASSYPVNPAGGTIVTLRDDDYSEVPLQGHTFNFYGTDYDTLYIGSNGYITFGSGDTHYLEQLAEHFALPRISALFDDLDPSAGGTISYEELPDKVVVTFQDIHEFSQTSTNSFQIEMFFDGRIRITFLNIAAVDGLTGLSQGNGVPLYFNESNLSAYDLCKPPIRGDFNTDGKVDFSDMLIFANHWLQSNCAVPYWCDGTDLNQNGSVNFTDFAEFAQHWLEK